MANETKSPVNPMAAGTPVTTGGKSKLSSEYVIRRADTQLINSRVELQQSGFYKAKITSNGRLIPKTEKGKPSVTTTITSNGNIIVILENQPLGLSKETIFESDAATIGEFKEFLNNAADEDNPDWVAKKEYWSNRLGRWLTRICIIAPKGYIFVNTFTKDADFSATSGNKYSAGEVVANPDGSPKTAHVIMFNKHTTYELCSESFKRLDGSKELNFSEAAALQETLNFINGKSCKWKLCSIEHQPANATPASEPTE